MTTAATLTEQTIERIVREIVLQQAGGAAGQAEAGGQHLGPAPAI